MSKQITKNKVPVQGPLSFSLPFTPWIFPRVHSFEIAVRVLLTRCWCACFLRGLRRRWPQCWDRYYCFCKEKKTASVRKYSLKLELRRILFPWYGTSHWFIALEKGRSKGGKFLHNCNVSLQLPQYWSEQINWQWKIIRVYATLAQKHRKQFGIRLLAANQTLLTCRLICIPDAQIQQRLFYNMEITLIWFTQHRRETGALTSFLCDACSALIELHMWGTCRVISERASACKTGTDPGASCAREALFPKLCHFFVD